MRRDSRTNLQIMSFFLSLCDSDSPLHKAESDLQKSKRLPQVSRSDCPACRGAHRKHTREGFCRLASDKAGADNGKQRRISQQSNVKPNKKSSLEAEQPYCTIDGRKIYMNTGLLPVSQGVPHTKRRPADSQPKLLIEFLDIGNGSFSWSR